MPNPQSLFTSHQLQQPLHVNPEIRLQVLAGFERFVLDENLADPLQDHEIVGVNVRHLLSSTRQLLELLFMVEELEVIPADVEVINAIHLCPAISCNWSEKA